MKANELREKSMEELVEALKDLNEERFNLKIQKGLGQLESSARVRQVRRDIARVKTLMTQKKSSK